ncbi:DUF192 domain-containing protein [Pseudooceanicola aestuarii]|uniref:DUF192 domain-containing protein n=1 Tax=Pseudooceanicola aestuarii TaxID=2697319 RepID=UPI0013D73224|nr:DUF192 domain-containing protein [Pseudooceanicola aestuarii]
MRHLGVIAGLVGLALSAGAASAACRVDRVELRGDFGSARFRVELADDGESRARGLMFREEMPRSAGMLFLYPDPQPVISFWMRNTLIPLDILYIDATGTVRGIAHEAQPLDETGLPGPAGSQYVLEINGGLARAMGITEGTQLRHPEIDQSQAAWPCAER